MIKRIKLGGEDRPICFNFNCLEEFEELTGIDALNNLKITAKSSKALIYCGLKYGLDPEGRLSTTPPFDMKTVGAWLDGNTITTAMRVYNSQDHPPTDDSDGKKKVKKETLPEKAS